MAAKEIGTAATEEAKDLGSAAKREAKDLGMAATRKATEKVMELGERRRRKRSEKHNEKHNATDEHDATEAAIRQASELGVDLGELEGSGAEGRITVRDVKQAAQEQ